jgi:hypothetical protein
MNDKFSQKGFKKGHKESNEPNPLSEDEYQLLLKKNFKTEALNRTKDRFLLQCTLGCRYSDLFTFTPSNFKSDKLIYKPIKTSRRNTTQFIYRYRMMLKFYLKNISTILLSYTLPTRNIMRL